MFASRLLGLMSDGYDIHFSPNRDTPDFQITLIKDNLKYDLTVIMTDDYRLGITDEELLCCVIKNAERAYELYERSEKENA